MAVGRPAARRRSPRDPGERLASAVSYVLNPLVFPPVAFTLIAAHFHSGAAQTAAVFGVSLVFFCLVPLLYVVGMIRAGRAESLEVRNRASRTRPFLVGVASYAVGAGLLGLVLRGPALPVVLAFAALFPLNTLVIALINLRWKISIHMTSLAGFVGVLLFVAMTAWRSLPAGPQAVLTVASVAPLLVLLPLVMWARVRVEAHSLGQVVAGAVFGLLVPVAQLYVIAHHWLGLA